MDTIQPPQISVLEPVGAAFEKTKQILFQPFDIGKWFILGFVVWLATLWERGGFNFNFNFQMPFEQNEGPSFESQMDPEFKQMISEAKMFVLEHLNYFIAGGIVIILGFIVLSLVLLWIKSRFQFIFLRNVAVNKLAITASWNEFSEQGNSLFGFKLFLALVHVAISLILLIPVGFILFPLFQTDFRALDVGKAVIAGVLIFADILTCIFLGIVKVVTKDFVVPVMYLRYCRIIDGWKIFWNLFKSRISVFILYLLCIIIISLGISIIAGFVILSACCCFCFIAWIFLIPILGQIIGGYVFTILTLPLFVWRRAYSALFLAQFGPQFDVFAQAEPVVVPTDAFPVSPEAPETPPQDPQY